MGGGRLIKGMKGWGKYKGDKGGSTDKGRQGTNTPSQPLLCHLVAVTCWYLHMKGGTDNRVTYDEGSRKGGH